MTESAICSLLKKQTETQKTNFELTNGLWIEAEVPKSEKVYLWLGVNSSSYFSPKHQANVMVEYSFDEAIQLLTNNLEQGKKALEKAESDMTYMKDQITVTEVSIQQTLHFDFSFFPSLL